ncbi:hypothetical protein GETHOR_28460 [Geothrix oryzae]|uniref:Uncharacterized protein n=1 Tax=Geothrix oryzae TaxID=2927975 RepID=A0ABN6VAB3_9BACT|nr:hypothetical protein [Geothrix oryzae]BDU70745.1 hypothetical protein GETHOR_28460 [Geothrix oryzae]
MALPFALSQHFAISALFSASVQARPVNFFRWVTHRPMPETATIELTLELEHPVVIWVLQLGGWLPLPFSSANIILVDRCITAAISKLINRPDRKDLEAERWWLSYLNNSRYQLNSFIQASEGQYGRIPSYDEFSTALNSTNILLSKSLPEAHVFWHNHDEYPRLYEVITAIAPRHQREVDFLVEVSPILSARVSERNTNRVESQILELASKYNILKNSLVLFAALSCLYEPQDGSEPRIGRGVLKPKGSYSHQQAYNALSDIRSLEYLAAGSGLFGTSVGLCTRDKYLAAFWTYLNIHNPQWSEDRFSAKITPKPELFPRLNLHQIGKLLSRLRAVT